MNLNPALGLEETTDENRQTRVRSNEWLSNPVKAFVNATGFLSEPIHVHRWFGATKVWRKGGLKSALRSARAPAEIGVGMAGLAPPLPPNRTGGFPASGSPVGGF
jgi:hypothetical protein